MGQLGFIVYLLFMASWFLHLTSRVPALGVVRFDLLLVVLLFLLKFLDRSSLAENGSSNIVGTRLKQFVIAVFLITPFAEFPGSVMKFGLANFIKAIVFYFFTVWFVKNSKQFYIFISMFVFYQTFRIIEPLYLHVTEGYWGSMAAMANWEYMNRLAGAPYDVVNPNGLAYIILTILPFIFYLYRVNWFWKIFTLTVLPLSLYSLMLTGSRSGFIGLIILVIFTFYYSKHKLIFVVVLLGITIVLFGKMDDSQKDRYLSIVDSNAKNAETSEGRFTGLLNNLNVGFRKPFVGHGLGTSLEANANFGHSAQPAHNIFIEVFQEVGFVGFIPFIGFMVAILKSTYRKLPSENIDGNNMLIHIKTALKALSTVTIIFGFASYGLSSYEWYFMGGCIAVLGRISVATVKEYSRI